MEKKPQRIAKEEAVQDLRDKMRANSVMLLLEYKGINVAADTALRRKFREANVTYFVARNTLIKRAAHAEGIEFFDPFLAGTTSISLAQDPVTLAKLVTDFAKQNEFIKVKVGMIDGKMIPGNQIKNLSKLPSREVLLSQVVGTMQSPLVGFAGAMQGLLRNFVSCLDQVREQKAAAGE